MSMQHLYTVRDTHTRPVTAFGRNPHRRELLVGFEDGVVKTYDCETGFLVQTTHQHQGFITDFAYWWSPKFLFSCSNDGTFIVWASGGGLYYKHKFPFPLYSMVLNEGKNQIIIGSNSRILAFQLDEKKISGSVLRFDSQFQLTNKDEYHCDIVRRMLLHETRLFTAGYDHRLVIFEVSAVSYGNRKVLHKVKMIPKAHDTAIVCMVINSQSANNQWLATGAFDRSLKFWTLDGDPTFRIDDFQGGCLSSFCYIGKTKNLWVACGFHTPLIYDPKSGDNVTEYVEVKYREDYPRERLTKMQFFPQLNMTVATNVRRHLLVWKFNPHGCTGILNNSSPVLSLAYTKKEPILVFSGALNGATKKWERAQANMFAYSQDTFSTKDAQKKLMEARGKMNAKMGLGSATGQLLTFTPLMKLKKPEVNDEDESSSKLASRRQKRIKSAYLGLNKPLERSVRVHRHSPVGQLRQLFVEELDLLISACEDSNIYVWGFDARAVKSLKRVVLNSEHSEESITKRVAGFSCRSVYMGHRGPVTSLMLISGFQHIYLLSAGWDRRILIWNLDKDDYEDSCQMGPKIESKDPKEVKAAMEICCDGAVLDMVYAPERNEFAYGCADRLVYIRKFSPSGQEMGLVNTLVGHLSEVTCVAWIADLESWVSGSDDATVRVWSSGEHNECLQAMSMPGPVGALQVDNFNRVLVVASLNLILVYDIFSWRMVQRHKSSVGSIINCLLLLPERSQYLSGGTDGMIQLWTSFKNNFNAGSVSARQLEQQKIANILHGTSTYPYSAIRKQIEEEDVFLDPINMPQLSREVSRGSLLSLTTKSRKYSADSNSALG